MIGSLASGVQKDDGVTTNDTVIDKINLQVVNDSYNPNWKQVA